MKPIFINIDGIDGSGKGLLIENLLKDWKWGEIDHYFDPGISSKPEHLKWQEMRKFIKTEPMDPMTETLMFFALRSELMANVEKSLSSGHSVLQDRGVVSSKIYQGYCKGQTKFIEDFESICHFRKPDILFILFAPFEVLSERLIKRNANMDKFKQNIDFRKKVWDGYKWYIENKLTGPHEYMIDASGTPEEVKNKCLEIIKSYVSRLG